MTDGNVIDMHIHFGAPRDLDSGCYWSKEFEKTAAYYAMRLITRSLFKTVDIRQIKDHLLQVINDSRLVETAVLLALDEVYDQQGRRLPGQTHLHVPNSYLAGLSQENPRIKFGCSVHPYRRDWEVQLLYALENGTVLCKWIPSSQQIDPGHMLCQPFYRRLADLKLPLLCHAGPEYAIPTSDKNYNVFNNPGHLRTALEAGVVVIVAHCALPYFWFLDTKYQEDFREFLRLIDDAEKYHWNLYADVSAIATPLRAPYIKSILENVPSHRLLFGSDYPIPLSEITYNRSRNFLLWLNFMLKTLFIKNPLDKNFLLIKKMGFDPVIFENAHRLFSEIDYP